MVLTIWPVNANKNKKQNNTDLTDVQTFSFNSWYLKKKRCNLPFRNCSHFIQITTLIRGFYFGNIYLFRSILTIQWQIHFITGELNSIKRHIKPRLYDRRILFGELKPLLNLQCTSCVKHGSKTTTFYFHHLSFSTEGHDKNWWMDFQLCFVLAWDIVGQLPFKANLFGNCGTVYFRVSKIER